MEKWTKGPWREKKMAIDTWGGLHSIYAGDGTEQSNRILVARTCFAPASDANARLIATAPELAECLREMSDKVIALKDKGVLPDGTLSFVLSKARALLARLDGEA